MCIEKYTCKLAVNSHSVADWPQRQSMSHKNNFRRFRDLLFILVLSSCQAELFRGGGGALWTFLENLPLNVNLLLVGL